MISWVILEREREYLKVNANKNRRRLHEESPYISERNQTVDVAAFKDNWYRFILYKIASGCREAPRLSKNKVKFITFNYDVSLETYLYKGLRQIEFLKKSNGDIISFLENRFVHMYGKIREFPFVDPVPVIEKMPSSKLVRNYSGILEDAYRASLSIRTIGDDKDDNKAITQAQEFIDWAGDVYILGYGFDENNNHRLGLEKLQASQINQQGEAGKKSIKKRIYLLILMTIIQLIKKHQKF